MTEKYRTLENTIRDAARKAMQEKSEDAKVRFTTKVMEPVKQIMEMEVSEEDLENLSEDYGKGKLFAHMDDSHDSHRQRMVHSVTAYDRTNSDRAAKKGSYYNHYALGHYLKAVDGAHAAMKKGVHPAEAINQHFNGPLAKRLHKHLGTGGTDLHTQQKAMYKEEVEIEEKINDEGKKLIRTALSGSKTSTIKQKKALIKLAKAHPEKKWEVKKEEVEIKELAPTTTNSIDTSAKLDNQRKAMAKQKQAMQAELQRQKQAKAAQDAKDRAMEQAELKKVREAVQEAEELTERGGHTHNYERATKLLSLHSKLYNKLSAAGDLAKAEMHRKKASEYKRIAYSAKDNPGKLPSV